MRRRLLKTMIHMLYPNGHVPFAEIGCGVGGRTYMEFSVPTGAKPIHVISWSGGGGAVSHETPSERGPEVRRGV